MGRKPGASSSDPEDFTFVFEELSERLLYRFPSQQYSYENLELRDGPPISVPKRKEEFQKVHTNQLQLHRRWESCSRSAVVRRPQKTLLPPTL